MEHRLRRRLATLVTATVMLGAAFFALREEPAPAHARERAPTAAGRPSASEPLAAFLAPSRWGNGWRTFAAPLPLGNDAMLLFQRDGDQAIGWRLDWQAGTASRLDLRTTPIVFDRETPRRYSAVASSAGIWLFGPAVVLLRPDGELLRLPFDANEPVATALKDGSLLVIGKSRHDEAKMVRRLTLGKTGLIEVSMLPDLPVTRRHGVAAATLADGRVMVAGGDGADQKVHLFDPGLATWSETAALSAGRVNGVLLPLPDGRAVIAGGGWSSHAGAHLAEIWEPATGSWQSLPPLPLSLKITAHGAETPGGTVLTDGSIALGGGLDRGVLVLKSQGTGWAPHWRVAAMTDVQRAGGILQALGSKEVVVAGGVFQESGGPCCTGQGGASRVSWLGDGGESGVSLGLQRTDPTLAQLGNELFVSGGWNSFHMSFGAIQFSAAAELIDLKSGQTRQIAPLPAPIGSGNAFWIDGQRLVVKGIAPDKQGDFRGLDSRGIETPEGSGLLAIYDRRTDRWQEIRAPRLAEAQMIGLREKEAILVSSNASVWAVHLETQAMRELPRAARQRRGGVGRVLSDGRLVLAGGQAQATMVSLIDADCDRDDCPERHVGFGGLLPADSHEIFDPRLGAWHSSAPAQGRGTQAAILADGRVVQIGFVAPAAQGEAEQGSAQAIIERSRADGSAWEQLPLPPGIVALPKSDADRHCSPDDSPPTCALLLGSDPLHGGEELLFFRWRSFREAYPVVWLFDEAGQHWLPVADNASRKGSARVRLPPRGADQPGTIRGSYVIGFEHGAPAIWAE